MMSTDHKQIKETPHKSRDLMDVWVRERKEVLAKQLADNAEVKKRWIESEPIKVSQSQCGYSANAEVRTGIEVDLIP